MEYQKKVSKNAQQNNSETVTNQNDTEMHKERDLSPEGRQKIIINLRSRYISRRKTKNYY